MERKKRIGIFSGSFDPVHTGHMMLASYLAQSNWLDEVWMLVTPRNPLKPNGTVASDIDRLEMCRRAAEPIPGCRVSDFEFSLPQPSYTCNTLHALSDKYPDCQFSLIIGSDNWQIFHQWWHHDEIIKEFGVIIYPRPGYDIATDKLPTGVKVAQDVPMALISSTFIRKYLKDGHRLNYFVPAKALEYIITEKLYD